MSVIHINQKNYREEILSSEKPVLLDFWASWCMPCRMLSPVLEDVAASRPDVKVCKINIDEEPELANQYHVMSIPTLVVMKDGKIVNQTVGVQPKARILSML